MDASGRGRRSKSAAGDAAPDSGRRRQAFRDSRVEQWTGNERRWPTPAARWCRHSNVWPALLLGGTVLVAPSAAFAQDTAPAQLGTASAARRRPRGRHRRPRQDTIRTIIVAGAAAARAATPSSATSTMRVGQTYTQALADQALKDLYATELFSDRADRQRQRQRRDHGAAKARSSTGSCLRATSASRTTRSSPRSSSRRARSSPVPKSAPTLPASSSCTSARAASPRRSSRKMVQLDAEPRRHHLRDHRGAQVEGPPDQHHRQREVRRRRVARPDGHQGSRAADGLFSSATSYDPDRLAFDQQKLRQFYLTEGYADFRVVSAVAELTPDKRDFIITYVVEEGERYKFGDVAVDSQIRDFDAGDDRDAADEGPATGTTPSWSRTPSSSITETARHLRLCLRRRARPSIRATAKI